MERSFCGKGNARKGEVIEAVIANGFSPASSDEADALSILHWVIETNGGLG